MEINKTRCLLILMIASLYQVNTTCFTATSWDKFMAVIYSETHANMTASLCEEGCLSLTNCTGYILRGTQCMLFGKVYDQSLDNCCVADTYYSRTIGCTNPASPAYLTLADASSNRLKYLYDAKNDTCTFGSTTISTFQSCTKSYTNMMRKYEAGPQCAYLERSSFPADGTLQFEIDFPAEQVASMDFFTELSAYMTPIAKAGITVCSWTNCQYIDITTGELTFQLPLPTGSMFSSPLRVTIVLSGTIAGPQIFRYTATEKTTLPRSLEIYFNLK